MTTVDTNQLERLPWELLEKIVEQLPVPDILVLKQVNRSFCDLIRCSLRIQHRLDLCAAGLEPNWAAGTTVADSIKALAEYRSGWDDLNFDEYQTTARIPPSEREATAGGVYGVVIAHEIQFFTLPSNSRTIQPKKQTISLGFNAVGFAFHPQADVVAVAERIGRTVKLHLITMSEGLPHPSAHNKTLECVTGPLDLPRGAPLSITGQRLASMVDSSDPSTFQLNIWDWRTGEQLFERRSPHHRLLEFLDDYRLAVKVPSSTPPRLLLLDTEEVSSGVPVQTWFHGPTFPHRWAWAVETGGYKPSPQDILTAPFYPGPSQRILTLSLDPRKCMLVMKVETLLRLARERAGGKIQWQEWNQYLFETTVGAEFRLSPCVRSWVSGFRLFRVSIRLGDSDGCDLHVYDFSPNGRMMHLQPAGSGRQVMHPSVAKCRLPWERTNICNASSGHDGVVFQIVRGFSSS